VEILVIFLKKIVQKIKENKNELKFSLIFDIIDKDY